MTYRIDTRYVWYNKESEIVLMYFINHVPFTFDDVPDSYYYDPEIVSVANNERRFEPEDLMNSSFYLIDEEAHPCLFLMDLENPEDMPEEIYYYDEEDLMG